MNLNKYTVHVLLSTYNGESYIGQQLESLISQEEIDLQLYIRDDGSVDDTLKIIQHYVRLYPETITLYSSSNIGAKHSFFSLIQNLNISTENEYVAFCDQDDVWHRRKLVEAISKLNYISNNIIMYCSTTQMVDKDLIPLYNWPDKPAKPLSIYNGLVENVAVGCTIVLSLEAYNIIKSRLPQNIDNIIMHDWWCYLCISAFGKVVFDSTPYIRYRQHDNNVMGGSPKSLITKWSNRYHKLFVTSSKEYKKITKQISEFYLCYHDLLDHQFSKDISNLLKFDQQSIFKRVKYAMNMPIYRQKKLDNLVVKLVYVLGRL